MSKQDGWCIMCHLQIKYDSSTDICINIKDVFIRGNGMNLAKRFETIIHILNYMYAEVIKTFIDHIRIIIKQCQDYNYINRDVKNFIEGKAHETYQNIKKKNSLIVYDNQPKFLLKENLKQYEAQQYKNMDLSHFLSDCLNEYYAETSKYLYKNLGFEKVLEFKKKGNFRIPIESNINQNKGINLINTITKESGWVSLKHINVEFNDQIISGDRILRDPVNKLNFHCKRLHIIRLIKCIYTEVIFKYNKYVCDILNLCGSDYTYFNLVRQFFDTIHKTDKMLDIMIRTLVSLNTLIGEYDHDSSHSNIKGLYSLITHLSKEIKFGNYSLDDLDSKSDVSKKEIARSYIKKFSDFRSKIFDNRLKVFHKKQCPSQNILSNIVIHEFPFLKNTDSVDNTRFTELMIEEIVLSFCNQLIEFSENVIKSFYEDLGLNKLN
ncbi:uncharacterized protein LOC126908436 [Daktulosphaira vitifoliae]|uniref:uncharacterized protein LOC126908436 n=1 Tax=Daktulosphaira vitifoliae TaxID=58002 RepID=UPI0021AA89D2|nr:uncharacterized protein LOC126908436 [Daktulosphaira vitifoliae]